MCDDTIVYLSCILLKVDCYDWDSDGSHDFIGQFTTNLNEMEKAGKPNEVQIEHNLPIYIYTSLVNTC
jgi:Ca2+-dependent lipid-binding protein